MPVYVSISPLPDGTYWANMMVRNDAIKVRTHFSEILGDPQAAHKYLVKTAMLYWRKKIQDFVKSREVALMQVQCFGSTHQMAIAHINRANEIGSNNAYLKHEAWCRAILQAHDYLVYMVPGKDSPHRNWRFHIAELLNYCHSSLRSPVEKTVLQPNFIP